MIWTKVKIKTTTVATDIVASVLFDYGICGVEIVDNQNLTKDEMEKMFVDIPEEKVDDGNAEVCFYVVISDDKNGVLKQKDDKTVLSDFVDNSYRPAVDNVFNKNEFEKILTDVKEELDTYRDFVNMGTLDIAKEELDDTVFLNKWKENFKDINIGDLIIKPYLLDIDDNTKVVNDTDDKLIYINPGSAFGTGSHATTKLCIEAMRDLMDNNKKLQNNNFLDIGCGSGILSIVGYKLGFKDISMIDIDETTELNIIDNLKLNNINYKKVEFDSDIFDNRIENNNDKQSIIKYGFGNILTDDNIKKNIGARKYDIVVANILAPVIISIIDKLHIERFINNDGYFICSGIIAEMENDVVKAIKNNKNLSIVKIMHSDNWVCIVCSLTNI